MIVPNYFEDMSVLHLNTQPNRAYYIPAGRPMGPLVTNREDSDRFQLLNGDWKFRYYACVHDLQDAFYAEGFDLSGFDTIPVPSVWQCHGYDQHQYSNTRFPFPYDPPYVPYENPCGAYVRHFAYTPNAAAPKAYLNFEGVDSCFYVWLNGAFVGYSQVSHATAEFDVTSLLRAGENTLAVLVLKWCDGSYLEDQDKFRTSGIFRDVYLLTRPENHVRDYFITTEGNRIRVRLQGSAAPACKLYDGDQLLCSATAAPVEDADYPLEAMLEVSDPILWNPETPYLYTLLLETSGEVITERVAFRRIHIEGTTVCLNGSPIKFRGINRHDSDPVTGPAVDLKHILRDLRMFQEFNFNAVRTSHYPNDPRFYQLCDEFGFMVIDEADHESHGCDKLYRTQDMSRTARWCAPQADNPAFTAVTLDRTQLLVQRDKNRPCVLIWSMGNECAYGCAFEAAQAWTKAFDPTRLTHYESALYGNPDKKYDYSNLDLFSYMYPSFQRIDEYFAASPDKPFLMCEYAHAMGNGPGDLEDYWQVIQKHDGFCGGFIWEWCDHAVYKGLAENGKAMYYYGGDHGEFPHDSNFCVDGMVYPDRTPSTGLWEYWNVHRPARVVRYENGVLRLHNYLDFTALDQALTASYELRLDGQLIGSGEFPVPAIAPHEEGDVSLPLRWSAGKATLKVLYHSAQDHPLCPAGHLLGFDELSLGGECSSATRLWQLQANGAPAWTEDERYITVSGQQFTYKLDKRTGLWATMEYMGKALLEKPMELNIWRAPTDNDRKIKLVWAEAGYDRTVTRNYETQVEAGENGLCIRCVSSISAVYLQRILNVRTEWTVDTLGNITAAVHGEKTPEFPSLPRFGLRLFLPNAMEQVRYLGIGPMESYCDKHRAGWYADFVTTVTDLHEDYIKPQENGSHWGCDLLQLTTTEESGLTLGVTGPQPFSFNASHYTQEALTKTPHSFQLEQSGMTVLCLDGFQAGIGSNSCGPTLLEQYQVAQTSLDFTLRLLPGTK